MLLAGSHKWRHLCHLFALEFSRALSGLLPIWRRRCEEEILRDFGRHDRLPFCAHTTVQVLLLPLSRRGVSICLMSVLHWDSGTLVSANSERQHTLRSTPDSLISHGAEQMQSGCDCSTHKRGWVAHMHATAAAAATKQMGQLLMCVLSLRARSAMFNGPSHERIHERIVDFSGVQE